MSIAKLVQILVIAVFFGGCTKSNKKHLSKTRASGVQVTKQDQKENTSRVDPAPAADEKVERKEKPQPETKKLPEAQKSQPEAKKLPEVKTLPSDASAVVGAKPASEVDQVVLITSGEKKEAQSDKNEIKVSEDTEEIKKEEMAKVSFKDLEGLKALQSQKEKVLLKGKLVALAEGMTILENGNEDHFCQVEGAEKFHKDDFVKLEGGGSEVLNQENEIYRTSLSFKNKNGQLKFTCTHNTKGFFLEEMRINFNQYILIYGMNGSAVSHKDYVNPATEDRLLEAIRISDLANLEKTFNQENAKETFAIIDGEVKALEQAYNTVRAVANPMACEVSDVIGKMDSEKVFVQVERGIGEDTPKNIPTAGIYYVYRADKDNAFMLYCIQNKRAPLSQMFITMKNLFKFGVLERKEYKKRKAELVKIHKEHKKSLEGAK